MGESQIGEDRARFYHALLCPVGAEVFAYSATKRQCPKCQQTAWLLADDLVFVPRRKVSNTPKEGQDRDLTLRNAIQQAELQNQHFSDGWVSQFRDDSPSLCKGVQTRRRVQCRD